MQHTHTTVSSCCQGSVLCSIPLLNPQCNHCVNNSTPLHTAPSTARSHSCRMPQCKTRVRPAALNQLVTPYTLNSCQLSAAAAAAGTLCCCCCPLPPLLLLLLLLVMQLVTQASISGLTMSGASSCGQWPTPGNSTNSAAHHGTAQHSTAQHGTAQQSHCNTKLVTQLQACRICMC
jgi:hypothetical protein